MDYEYIWKLYYWLISIKPGTEFDLVKLVKQDNRDKFYEALQICCECWEFDGGIELTNGGTCLRRIEIF